MIRQAACYSHAESLDHDVVAGENEDEEAIDPTQAMLGKKDTTDISAGSCAHGSPMLPRPGIRSNELLMSCQNLPRTNLGDHVDALRDNYQSKPRSKR